MPSRDANSRGRGEYFTRSASYNNCALASRLLDLSVATAVLAAGFPIMLAIAIGIKITSPGPVLFKQERIGLGGKAFKLWKFRTMHVGPAGSTVTSRNDPRVTMFGALLRRSKLDELPQLVNVLKGDMALVGPRPEVRDYVERWDPELRETVLAVRPGLTDPATIRFRSEESLLAEQTDPETYYAEVLSPLKLAISAEYAQTRTVLTDCKILLATLRIVVKPDHYPSDHTQD